MIAFNATVSAYQGVVARLGFEDHAKAIRAAWETRDWAGMIAAVSDEMIDTIALAGTPDEVRDRFHAEWADLYEIPLLWPSAFRGLDGVRAVIDCFGGA